MHFFHFLTQEKIGFKLSEIIVGSRIQGSKRYRIPDPGSGSATLVHILSVAEPEPQGAETFGRSWSWNEISPPAPGFGSELGQNSILNQNSKK